MNGIDSVKDNLIGQLWCPVVARAGPIFFPRRRNRKMKVLTLTNDRNFREIAAFKDNKLTRNEDIIVWTHSHIKKVRLETEVPQAQILGLARYEDSFGSSCSLWNDFPFDVLNLDFASQDIFSENGRIEKEIESLETTLKRQYEAASEAKRAVLIYTTMVNGQDINAASIINKSNSLIVAGQPFSIPQNVGTGGGSKQEKIDFIENIIKVLCSKYGYANCMFERMQCPVAGSQDIVYSIATIIQQ